MKAPSTNIQAPEKLQAPTSNARALWLGLDVEVWSFSGAWILELGSYFPSSELWL
jgi:hypothetical protein